MKTGRIVARREVSSEDLNFLQKCSHDLAVRAILLDKDKSIVDGGNDVSQLLLCLGQGSCRKSYVLDSIVMTLKHKHSFNDKNYLVIASTGKATSGVCGSILYSHKEGLLLLVREKFKELMGTSLSFLQCKYKNKLKLIF